MATLVVALDGVTRHDDSDANTIWSNLGGGGPAPSSEPQLRYQYSGTGSVGVVNRKVTATSAREGVEAEGGTARDLATTGDNFALVILKGYVADFGDLNATYGVEYRVGSAAADHYHYNVAGSGANGPPYDDGYPPRGGYLIVAIDPNVAGWREGTAGTPALATVDYFGMACQFVVGGAKSENMGLDAIDVITDHATGGGGLKITRGDSTDPDATFEDLAIWDEATIARRYGLAVKSGAAIILRAWHTIGESGTATVFTSIGEVVQFPDGYHSAGSFGIAVDLGNAGTDVTIDSTVIGEGNATTEDTRPDFVVTGTSGALSLLGALDNFRRVTLTSVCDVNGAKVKCELLTQASAEIQHATILTNSLTSVACLQDPTFGETTGLHDTAFVQAGAGHALEIDTATSYDLYGLTFSGYGADTTDSAAIDVTASSGTVTLNILGGGDVPTYKTAGATVVIVQNPVTTTVTVRDTNDFSVLENCRVWLLASDGTGPSPYEDSVTITRVTTTATVAHTAHGLKTGQKVLIEGADQPEYNGTKTITVTTVDAYTFTVAGSPTTPATGTITSTGVLFNDLTNVSGVVSDTRTYTANQPLEGWVRRSTTSPLYRTQNAVVLVNKDTGATQTVLMVPDE